MGSQYQQIGATLRSLRELRGKSVTEVAQGTSFTSKSLILAENGQAEITVKYLLELCRMLAVTPNDILQGQFIESAVSYVEPEPLPMEPYASSANKRSMTYIRETNETLYEMKSKVREYQKEARQEESVPSATKTQSSPTISKQWRTTYYR